MPSNRLSRCVALAALALATSLSGCSDDEPPAVAWMSVVDDEGGGTGQCSMQFTEEDTGGGCGVGYRDGTLGVMYEIIEDGIARITVMGAVTAGAPESALVERVYEESFALGRKVEETPFSFDGRAMRLRVEGLGRAVR